MPYGHIACVCEGEKGRQRWGHNWLKEQGTGKTARNLKFSPEGQREPKEHDLELQEAFREGLGSCNDPVLSFREPEGPCPGRGGWTYLSG